MKTLFTAFIATIALTSAAHAADKPVIGPAPAWVKPVAPPAAPGKTDEAPVRIELSDQQIALEPGKQTLYSAVTLKIQTPQGLSAGNISVPWRPDTDVLTVHKLKIRRGAETIDVLASGQTFTVVRREQNLESAMLDGVLTANIQPEGLQVGDTLEFAASIASSDPTLKGHVEQFAGTWNDVPITRAHLRIQWPSSLPVRLRQTAAFPALKPVRKGDLFSVEATLDNVQPIALPKKAPLRYRIGRLVEVTDFASWADLGALMGPLYDTAAVIPAQGSLRSELERIKRLSPDAKFRTEAALALVQDRVRYVALTMGAGGYVPADAATTWARRYGDCKGKTALLLALLHAMDISAEAVAVSTVFGDGMNARLPMAGLFNHVIVRATISGRTYWLDGTRTGDTSLDRLTTPNFGWGLPLLAKGATLVPMVPTPLMVPMRDTSIRLDASAGIALPAAAKIETILRGDEAISANAGLSTLVGAARERALRDYWKNEYDFIEVTSASATFDARTGEQRLVMEGIAKMDWDNARYETDGTSIGYRADFSRDPGPDRDAPFQVAYPYSNRTRQTIVLPKGKGAFTLGKDVNVNQTVAGIEYRRHAKIEGDVFTIEKTERSVAPEFAAKDAPAAQAALRALAERGAYLNAPPGYRASDAEVATTGIRGYVDRGIVHLDGGLFDEAIADFDQAHAIDPTSEWPLANRGLARVWKSDLAAAVKDLDAAARINPRNVVVFRARGLMAQQKGDAREAVAAYTSALEIEPGSSFALGARAQAARSAGNDEMALRDAAAAIKLRPGWLDLYLLRANILRSRGDRAGAIAEAAAVAAANSDTAYAHVMAANIYSALGEDAQAVQAYDRAIAIKPEAYIYVNRADNRAAADVAGRRADVEAALKLDPEDASVLMWKARILIEGKDFAGAIAIYTALMKQSSDDIALKVARGLAYVRSGDTVRAEADFKQARVNATPNDLNNICWAKATAGLLFQSALGDCDAALAKAPESAAYLDSRALVLLRLGRIDEAIADYGRALARSPNQASSLFGRAVAWARKGNREKSAVDSAAALRIDPKIRARFERYGVTL